MRGKNAMILDAIEVEYDTINPLIFQLSPVLEMTDNECFSLCQNNRDYPFERTAKGELIIMPPAVSETRIGV